MYTQGARTRNQRGFYLIGLLIVLIIIAILFGKQLLPDENGPGAVTYIDRSRDVACSVNRSTLATTVMSWRMSHPGEVPTIEKLRQAAMSVPTCPGHGIYEIGEDGTVYCSKHFPRPQPTPVVQPLALQPGMGQPGAGQPPADQPAQVVRGREMTLPATPTFPPAE